MESRQPNLYVVAGPNGAGKSTFARLFLPDYADFPGPELALTRIEQRVRAGGHFIPEEVVRRRFTRGLRNLFQIYAPIFDAWLILDNSMSPPEPVAFAVADQRFVLEKELFFEIQQEAGKS